MKIEKNITIRELPGFGILSSAPNDRVEIRDEDGSWSVTLEEATEMRDALTLIINHLIGQNIDTPAIRVAPRVWVSRDDIIPAEVKKVYDREGDTWARMALNSTEWALINFKGARVTDQDSLNEATLLEIHGPVTEVRP